MKRFILHWKTGKPEYIEGMDIADAFNKAGIGAGALAALDHWNECRHEDVKGCNCYDCVHAIKDYSI